MAYVPQFIPTNTQVLQGTLDQYQKASDMETARLNQANDLYSAIPTTNPYDTSEKNKIMGDFQKKVIEGLDKKYNYDRANTQYAKDLANEIRNLRSNPLWSLVKQRDELDKLRQNVIATKGADFYENFNPDTVTDINKLKDWKPMDINDVKVNAALKAKEYATSWKGRVADRKSIPGTIQYLDKWGASNETEAANYIDQHPEEVLSSIPQGFDPNDPRVFTAARNAWISNAIGEVKPSDSPDYEWAANERANAKDQDKIPAWVKRTNMGVNEPSPVEGLDKLEGINRQLAEIDANPNKTEEQIAQRDILQRQVDYARNEYLTVANTPKGKKSIEKGMFIINDKITNPLINKQQLFREFENYFVQTGAIGRSKAAGKGVGILNTVIEDFSPWFTKSTDGNGEDVIKPKSLKEASEEIATRLVGSNASDAELKKIKKEVLEATKEWDKYYRGVDSYGETSYKNNIETPVNDKLKEGKLMVADVYDPPYSIGSVDYDKAVDTVVRNLAMSAFEVETENRRGKLVPASVDEVKNIYSRLRDNQSKLTIHAAVERESEPRIIVTEPDGNKVVLKMNVGKMSDATAEELAKETGLPQFKDVLYKDIKLENKTYSLANNKDKTLTNIILGRYKDLKPFSGLEVTKVGGSNYIIKSDVITKQGYPNGYTTNSKTDLFETLDDIYSDYKGE